MKKNKLINRFNYKIYIIKPNIEKYIINKAFIIYFKKKEGFLFHLSVGYFFCIQLKNVFINNE